MNRFYSGKLLLSAEYFVLHGAQGLALPTQLGQHFKFEAVPKRPFLEWESAAPNTPQWFQAKVQLNPLTLVHSTDPKKGARLLELLTVIKQLQPDFLKTSGGKVTSKLDFNPAWGLGSSSTLIQFLADWATIDPYILLERSFGGSGYDIACATAKQPLLYRKKSTGPEITPCSFTPSFKEDLYFVYLNRKQNSQQAIAEIRNKIPSQEQIEKMDALTQQLLHATSKEAFQNSMREHEAHLSAYLGIPTVQKTFFKDFKGTLKSLGAWGGDFILALGTENTPSYFKAKGLETCFSYKDLIA
jgi:hypothetical protein